MSTSPLVPRLRRVGLAGLGTVAIALAATACGSDTAASSPASAGSTGSAGSPAGASSSAAAVATAPVLATVGDLEVAAGYVPAPASPDVAAAYLTIRNTGDTADTLLGATSDASSTTTMHRTEGGAMVMRDDVPVPAGGTVAFTPGADHLMLEPLTRTLAKGDRVTLTLRFARAGEVTVTLPVTGYATGGGLPSEALSPLPSTTAAP